MCESRGGIYDWDFKVRNPILFLSVCLFFGHGRRLNSNLVLTLLYVTKSRTRTRRAQAVAQVSESPRFTTCLKHLTQLRTACHDRVLSNVA